MIIKKFKTHTPKLHPTVRLAETAAVIGNVICEKNVNIWYGATIRGDMAEIFVGENTNIQDGSVLHCDTGAPVHLGSNVVVGHGAVIHSCTVGDSSLIGMGATLLSGCEIGACCIIGGGSLVTGKTVIPPHSIAVGNPAKVVGRTGSAAAKNIRYNTEKYVETAEEELELADEKWWCVEE